MQVSDDKLILSAMPTTPAAALDWRNDDVPPDGAVIQACAEDRHGRYIIPFPVRFQGDEWLNHRTGEVLQVFIAGWRNRHA